ncbi:hypothetical protein [Peptoniphilus asaccharolyticus]|uniref:hypothetical protein n=1 Tax=Peptoniphilus asaccharolyticus TaxID=1258 RepID=UPI001EE4E58F|nr:hypothetical protein [Peptoniphilus asaccharolyticus]
MKELMKTASGQGLLEKLINILTGSVSGETSFVEQITQVLIPIAISLVTIFWLLNFLDKLIRFRDNNFGWEHITIICVQLVIAKYCVQFAPKILDIMATIGDAVSSSINIAAPTITTINTDEVFRSIEGMNLIEKLITITQLAIPSLVAAVMAIGMYIVVYARGIELILLGAFSPLPMSTIMFDNVKDVGKRYLQNYLAVCLQAGVLMIIIIMGGTLFSAIVTTNEAGDTSGMVNLLFQLMMYYGVMLFAFFKSGSWAQKIVGLG